MKNHSPDLLNVALERLAQARLELPAFSTLDAMESTIRGQAKRVAPLVCLVHTAQARGRDDLAEMLCKRMAATAKKAKAKLEEIHLQQRQRRRRPLSSWKTSIRSITFLTVRTWAAASAGGCGAGSGNGATCVVGSPWRSRLAGACCRSARTQWWHFSPTVGDGAKTRSDPTLRFT
ncbi:hypothetical protein ACQPYK_24260 [Streptosporangium sp. CA-135522]|uniref:hypothetical protein n=1 Tax=Streptosporangium sp. CA-135522 TaxID=3240072 RepID=UPI003D93AD02